MKPRVLLLATMISTGLAMSGASIAQDQTMQPAATPQNTMQQPTTAPQTSAAQQPSAAAQNSTMQPPAAAPTNAMPTNGGTNSATYNSSQGQLTVNSKTAPTPSTASPPSFEQLSEGSNVITKEQAKAFPPLANDFIYVSGHSDHITKSQYEHWLQHLN
jgi:uncharacterized iron-regulated membrane protein